MYAWKYCMTCIPIVDFLYSTRDWFYVLFDLVKDLSESVIFLYIWIDSLEPCSKTSQFSQHWEGQINSTLYIYILPGSREGLASVTAKGTEVAILRNPVFFFILLCHVTLSVIDNDNMATFCMNRKRFVIYCDSKGSIIWVQAGSYPNWCFGRWAQLDETLGLLPEFY